MDLNKLIQDGLIKKTLNDEIDWIVIDKDARYDASFAETNITIIDNRGYCGECDLPADRCNCEEGPSGEEVSLVIELQVSDLIVLHHTWNFYGSELPAINDLVDLVKTKARKPRKLSFKSHILERYL
jgi:hypothetical protein